MASLAGYNYARYPRSTSGQPSIAKSTLAAARYIPGRDKRLVFASEWVFKPEGISAVKIKFQDALKTNDLIANHEWDDTDNVFRVRCIVADTPKVSAIFSDILSEIITESHGDDYLSDDDDDAEIMVSNSDGEEEPFKSDKIERLSTWRKRHGITDPTPQPETTPTATELSRQELDPVKSVGGAGSDEPKYVWTCEDTHLHLDDVASDDILKTLTDLTGCYFTKDLKEGKLFISHSSADSCQRAIKKLDILKKYSEPKALYLNHIVYTEGIEDFRLRFCFITDVKKRFFKTTLLHPYRMGPTMNYRKLTRAFTVRCAFWNRQDATYTPVRIGILVPVTRDPGAAIMTSELLKFEYRAKGSLENHPLRHVGDNAERRVSSLEERPNMPASVASGDLEQVKQTRIEGWAKQLSQEARTGAFEDVARESILPSSSIPKLSINAAQASQLTMTRNRAPTSIAPSLLDEDMPRMSFASLQPLRHSSTPLPCERLPSTASKSVSNVDPSITAQNVHSTAGGSPKQMFHTELLGQDPSPEFVTGINSSFKSLMTGLQGFPGEIIVQAELGKVILRKINPIFVTLDNQTESFPTRELLTQILPGSGKEGGMGQTFFTNILTTLSTDVNYLVDMKNQAGQDMWEKNVAESSIIYEISCHAEGLYGWNPFTIEIDGDNFNTRIKTRYDFGTINVHGTLRHWDFRIVAFGFGDDEQNERLYGDFARSIQRSLYIPPKLSKPCLYFELDEAFLEKSKLVIESILVHHTAKHKSMDKGAKSVLSISEILALDIDSRYPFPGAPFQIYKAEFPQAHRNGSENLNIWHEASISSAKANEQVKQNATLELGDEAKWSPEVLEQLDAASDMYLPACEMLKQMDGVGFHNDNGIELREPPANQSRQEQYYFW